MGGLIGVLRKSGSGLNVNETAEMGVADVISEGKVAVTGVVSFPNLGLAVGMMMVELTWLSRSRLMIMGELKSLGCVEYMNQQPISDGGD
jgi:hypothetical protein